jgi:glycosyltransferase involved in cell wall biosynthesis
VIPNGLDPLEARRLQARAAPEVEALRRDLGIPPGALVVGDVSRLDAKNDLMTWLEVVERVASRHPQLVALHAGGAVLAVEQAFSRRFEDEIRRRGLGSRVRLLGLRRDLERVLPALDLFLHTSTMEGFPNSIMEAMAAALPVVATAAGGTPELVVEAETGHLAPVRDAPALARCAADLLADPLRRRRMGEAGARRVLTQFSALRMVRSTEEAYDEILAGRCAPGAGAPGAGTSADAEGQGMRPAGRRGAETQA